MNNLFNETHLETVCPSCHSKKNNRNWKNEFSKHDHYRFEICECGYKIFIKSKINTTGIIEKEPHFSIRETVSEFEKSAKHTGLENLEKKI